MYIHIHTTHTFPWYVEYNGDWWRVQYYFLGCGVAMADEYDDPPNDYQEHWGEDEPEPESENPCVCLPRRALLDILAMQVALHEDDNVDLLLERFNYLRNCLLRRYPSLGIALRDWGKLETEDEIRRALIDVLAIVASGGAVGSLSAEIVVSRFNGNRMVMDNANWREHLGW